MARPRKEIDANQVAELAGFGLAVGEIASIMRCSPDTLQRRFAAAIKEGHERRNGSLRRKQYEVAMSGNATMLIWLGKQFLGQTDKQSMEHSGPEGGPIGIAVRFVSAGNNSGSSREA